MISAYGALYGKKERLMMEEAEFDQLVAEVIDNLPPEFGQMLDNVEVMVLPRAEPQHKRAVGLRPWHTLYGLYQGVPLTKRSHHYGFVAPDTIFIFREPLLRNFRHPDALRAQVRRTVLHELAHHFGISDERLRELGAY
jgi:predicted Zn-dependent protease with MMP-like domain